VNFSPVGIDNVIPRYPMLKRRRHKNNFRLHGVNIRPLGSFVEGNGLYGRYRARA
jgi:hypothetical protein